MNPPLPIPDKRKVTTVPGRGNKILVILYRISTLAFGSLLVGSWYIWEEGRSYQVAAEAERHAPHDLGTHREGTVNRDYVNYERWVERHGRK